MRVGFLSLVLLPLLVATTAVARMPRPEWKVRLVLADGPIRDSIQWLGRAAEAGATEVAIARPGGAAKVRRIGSENAALFRDRVAALVLKAQSAPRVEKCSSYLELSGELGTRRLCEHELRADFEARTLVADLERL